LTIIDANLLLYAYNADSPQQRAAAKWLAMLLKSSETIALPWTTVWAFRRNRRAGDGRSSAALAIEHSAVPGSTDLRWLNPLSA
jgi:predicted nucleic acid-binding protein